MMRPMGRNLCLSIKRIDRKPEKCYNKGLTQTPMNIESCIAHAINNDLDLLAAFPELENLPIDELESTVERYVRDIQTSLQAVILQEGDVYLRSKNAVGLSAICRREGAPEQQLLKKIPADMLIKMCQTIVQLLSVDAQFILDTDEGKSLFYVKMTLTAY